MNTPKKYQVYIADLAAYNAGYLHGIWLDITNDLDDIKKDIELMLGASPVDDAEEYAIHDFDGFGDLNLNEYSTLEQVQEVAEFLEEHEEIGYFALKHCDCSIDEAQAMIDSFIGEYESVQDYAEEITDLSGVPEDLQYYIDFQALARDLEMGGEIWSVETGLNQVYIFSNH